MSKLKVYSANQVSLIFANISLDSGRGDDEFVSWEKEAERFTYKAGVDGEGTRSESSNTHTKVVVKVMQTSDAMAKLSAIHNVDITTPGGAGVFPILIRDRQGTTVFASGSAWIVDHPKRAFGKEANVVEWEISVHDPKRADGGN